MRIAFTTQLDDKYMSGFLLTFNSILRVSPNFDYDLIVFEWGELSYQNKDIIKSLYKKVIFKSINVDLYKNHEHDDTFRKWTYNCNYRFDIFTLTEYDKVVYFDCDIIFQIDVDELLKYDVDFGACLAETGQVPQVNFFNAFETGLMVIGKRYLKNNVVEELIDIANTEAPNVNFLKTNKWTSDEPILNIYFYEKVTLLPKKFNLIVSEIENKHFNEKNNYQFTGHNKPWSSNARENQFSEYSLQKIEEKNKKFMKEIVLRKLVRLVEDEIVDLYNRGVDIYKYIEYKFECF